VSGGGYINNAQFKGLKSLTAISLRKMYNFSYGLHFQHVKWLQTSAAAAAVSHLTLWPPLLPLNFISQIICQLSSVSLTHWDSSHSEFQNSCQLSIARSCQDTRPIGGPVLHFTACSILYGKKLLAPRPNPKLEDHPLSAVRNCLFNINAVTIHFSQAVYFIRKLTVWLLTTTIMVCRTAKL